MKGSRLKGRNFLTLQDFSSQELETVIRKTRELRALPAEKTSKILSGKTLAMIFEKPSTRTRVSFEAAMRMLGGHALYLRWDDLQLARGETIADTVRVLNQYVHGIAARVVHHSELEEMAKYASIPVINGLSDLYHPCQAISDFFTIWDKKGSLKGLKLAWVGDGNNVCNSLLIGSSMFGMNMSVACPKGHEPDEEAVKWARKKARETRSKIEIVREPEKAVKGADVVYTDTFVSMGMEAEREERLRIFLPRYQVTSKLLRLAKKDAFFMHCLPAHRGEEVTDEVIDSPQSIVWEQAGNRLHTTKALLAILL